MNGFQNIEMLSDDHTSHGHKADEHQDELHLHFFSGHGRLGYGNTEHREDERKGRSKSGALCQNCLHNWSDSDCARINRQANDHGNRDIIPRLLS